MQATALCIYLGASLFALDADGQRAVPVANAGTIEMHLDGNRLTVYAGERYARGTTITLNAAHGTIGAFMAACEQSADDHAMAVHNALP